MNPIVVFDFDGVICDSTEECMLTSWNAWERWNDRSGYRTSLDNFSTSELVAFRSIRPYVRGAGEYYVLQRSLEENFAIHTHTDYEHYCQKWVQYLEYFKKAFFRERERLRSDNLNAWIKLHYVWPEVANVLKELNRQERAYIATLKDGESVRLILKSQGIDIPARRLLDQSQITNKLDALKKIKDIEGCTKKGLLFLDDNPTHLIEPFLAGYPCYMTGWGNTLKDSIGIAECESLPILLLNDIGNLLRV